MRIICIQISCHAVYTFPPHRIIPIHCIYSMRHTQHHTQHYAHTTSSRTATLRSSTRAVYNHLSLYTALYIPPAPTPHPSRTTPPRRRSTTPRAYILRTRTRPRTRTPAHAHARARARPTPHRSLAPHARPHRDSILWLCATKPCRPKISPINFQKSIVK